MTLAEAVSLAQQFALIKKCPKPLNRNLKVDPLIENKWFALRRKIWLEKVSKLGQKHSKAEILNERLDGEKIALDAFSSGISRVTTPGSLLYNCCVSRVIFVVLNTIIADE